MSQEEQRAIHFQRFLQYFQIIFMTLWKSRIRRLCKWICLQEQPHAEDALYGPEGRRKQYLDHWILRNFAPDTDFLKNWYEANLKQWKEDARLALFYQDQQFKIAVVNTKDRQGCRQSGCERILRKLRSGDDSRNSRYSNSYE